MFLQELFVLRSRIYVIAECITELGKGFVGDSRKPWYISNHHIAVTRLPVESHSLHLLRFYTEIMAQRQADVNGICLLLYAPLKLSERLFKEIETTTIFRPISGPLRLQRLVIVPSCLFDERERRGVVR